MARNVEIKARVRDFESIQQVAESLTDRPVEELRQIDTFFYPPRGRFKLREFADGRGELIAYARSDNNGPTLSDYYILRTDRADGMKSFLGELLGIRGIVKKRRLLYHIGPTRIHLDQVEGLGDFLELEVVLDDGEAESEGARTADEVMKKLGMVDAERIACAYIDLLEREDGAENQGSRES